jgi:hypothetical protein
MNPNEAFNELRSNPGRFLKSHPVNTAGWGGAHNAGNANPHQFRIYKRDANVAGPAPSGKPAHFGATRPGLFGSREVSSFMITTVPAPGGVAERQFNALSVPLHTYPNVNVAALDHYVVDGQGDGLMITGQLSGCTFAWTLIGANLLCTHIQPVGIQGVALHNRLNTNGRFAAHPTVPLNTYGNNDYVGQYANVIGVRRNGQWKLYSQHSADQFRTITGAWRIYPGLAVPL